MDFKKLSEVTQVTEAADTANVLIEEDGVVKRVPKSEVGGGSGNVVLFTTDASNVSTEESSVSEASVDDGIATADVSYEPTYSCSVTFDEMVEMIHSGDLTYVVGKYIDSEGIWFDYSTGIMKINSDGFIIAPTDTTTSISHIYIEFYNGDPLEYFPDNTIAPRTMPE